MILGGLVPWAFSPRTWFRGHPRAADALPVGVDARHEAGHGRRSRRRDCSTYPDLWSGEVLFHNDGTFAPVKLFTNLNVS